MTYPVLGGGENGQEPRAVGTPLLKKEGKGVPRILSNAEACDMRILPERGHPLGRVRIGKEGEEGRDGDLTCLNVDQWGEGKAEEVWEE